VQSGATDRKRAAPVVVFTRSQRRRRGRTLKDSDAPIAWLELLESPELL
jgi:hypothetical protein